MDALEAVAEHRAIGLGEDRGADLDGAVGADAEEEPRWKITVAWSPRPLEEWYAKANLDQNWVTVNCLLNSPDVPEEVLRYLLWHELLHIHLRAGHTPEFRKLERAWPSALEGDRFLDTLNERWCVEYW